MSWILIRHGLTEGNLQKRYVGCRTDESLCPEGIRQLKLHPYPAVQRVYTSPMQRCLETAAVIYPDLSAEIIPDFRECDFGIFEYKNYTELNGREDYQAWIDSGGELPFPGGESRSEFSARSLNAFHSLPSCPENENCALIVHGGTIMAIMEAMAIPHGNYYDYQIKNGSGYVLNYDGSYKEINN